ncbi:hypothetical protein P12x_004680 [Tundrisphaera lichenicola]|uniref:hypothetical protein n=1 Tax=Tundrisphaera lichenicola TaxID=2029860 RepID=UPI003EBBF1AD
MSHRTATSRSRGLVRALVLGMAASTPALAGDRPRGPDWIVGDAVASVEVVRPSDLIKRLTNEPVPTLLGSIPGYQRYLAGDAYREHRAALEVVSGRLGTTWDRALENILGDGLVLAIEPGTPPRGILVATPRDPAFLAKSLETLIALAREDAATKGKPDPIRSAEHRGVLGYNLGPNVALAIVDGTLVIAESAETLKSVIDRSIDPLDPGSTLAGEPLWKARRSADLSGDALAWAFLRVDRLRKLDSNALKVPDQVNPLAGLLFSDWVEAVRKTPWTSAGLTWTEQRLGLDLTVATPPEGYSEALRRYLPSEGKGASTPLAVKGSIASVSLWRDLSSLWEVRSDLFPPEVVQGFAQLDTVAGTFFGGRDFGTDVLGALGSNWRLVIASQDTSDFDPMPADKLPAFALIADLKPDDPDFAIRLKSAFQSIIGLINLGAAESKAPPLMLGSETIDGVAVATSKFLKPKVVEPTEPVHTRHNFTPSAAQVGDHFILSSSLGLVRNLIPALKNPTEPTGATVLIEADGAELAGLVAANRPKLVMQNMLEQGNDKPKAESEIDFLARALKTLGRGSFSAIDSPEEVRLRLNFKLQTP